MAPLAPDTVVDGRYRIIDRVGSGGMADVYCAEDGELGRRVAIKLLYSRFADDPDFVERFRREASSAAALNHPNVVQVFDRGEWDGTPYIAMELLEGRNLKDIVREHGPLEPAYALDMVLQILRAARFAHRRGVVHRDIKPHNVIVDAEGRAKVTDFGIARAGSSDMTETGLIMGTAQYISPEQAQGHPVDARSDLYSIGVVLYELLTGAVPFDAESPVTIALKQVSEEPVPPRVRNPAVPPALEAVVMRAIRKDPAERYQDADQFIAALENAAAGIVPPEDTVAELEELDRAGWRRIALVAAVVLALLAIAVGAFLLLTPDQKRVPDVVGDRSERATQRLQDAGFEVAIVPAGSPSERRREFSDTVARGKVIGTSPEGGTSVRRGTTVTLIVSRGREQVAVPDVVGQAQADAEAALQNAGLAASVSQREDGTVAAGTVLAQDPAAGTSVALGRTVALVVATAPAAVPVPGVIDQAEDDAVAALEDAGFRVRVRP